MDATAANIELSYQDFLRNLVDSRIVADDVLERVRADTTGDALALANSLLESGLLTDYQLDAINQGRQSELRVGNYDILARLGAGGMGTVFKARHRRMKRVVALKVLSGDLGDDPSFVQRFQREVETIARLGHPNVVMAYDADEAEIGHFLVMEFVNGRDLASLVQKQGPLPVHHAVDCVLQAARGLAYAHGQAIIHRDVKPHNLLRDQAGVVKITDLGLARLNTAESTAKSNLTQAGGILGTATYMPPEQALDSSAIDHRADIYSLGCTLFFLLAGRPPYSGQSVMAVLLKHREGPIPSLASVRQDAPPKLDSILARMMAKSVSDRFQSMAEVVAALEGVLSDTGSATELPSHAPAGAFASQSMTIARASDASRITNSQSAKPLSVLLVEPSRVQAGIIRKYLEAQDTTLTGAVAKGAEAIGRVRRESVDAIVSALYLPDMTGVDLAKRVREEVMERAPGFVLISSEDQAQEAGSLSQLDRIVFLHKPFSPEQLVHALNVVTGQSLTPKPLEGLSSSISGDSSQIGARSAVTHAPDLGRKRVLLVDDSAAARAHQRGILQQIGFAQIVEVADGAQAVATAAHDSFDLIITDYNMPLMDGHALVSYLKQTAATAGIPVVMVTTETDPSVLDAVRRLGVAAVFGKSFPADAVKALVDELFSAA
jgi:serine/threonine protein kinase/DNA-binding NarL/FixJ family response regulator